MDLDSRDLPILKRKANCLPLEEGLVGRPGFEPGNLPVSIASFMEAVSAGRSDQAELPTHIILF